MRALPKIIAILALMLGIVLAPIWAPGGAARAGGDERAAIVSVIENQLDAFQRDDARAAFDYASPGIRAMFESPENFLAMVAESYAPVYRPRSVRFLDLVDEAGQRVQRVLFTGPDGTPVIALYTMRRMKDGSWRIAGCVLLRWNGESA